MITALSLFENVTDVKIIKFQNNFEIFFKKQKIVTAVIKLFSETMGPQKNCVRCASFSGSLSLFFHLALSFSLFSSGSLFLFFFHLALSFFFFSSLFTCLSLSSSCSSLFSMHSVFSVAVCCGWAVRVVVVVTVDGAVCMCAFLLVLD